MRFAIAVTIVIGLAAPAAADEVIIGDRELTTNGPFCGT